MGSWERVELSWTRKGCVESYQRRLNPLAKMFMMKDMKGIMLATIAFLYLTNAYELMPDSVTTGIDNPTQYMPHAVDKKMARIFSSIAPNAMHKGVTDGQ